MFSWSFLLFCPIVDGVCGPAVRQSTQRRAVIGPRGDLMPKLCSFLDRPNIARLIAVSRETRNWVKQGSIADIYDGMCDVYGVCVDVMSAEEKISLILEFNDSPLKDDWFLHPEEYAEEIRKLQKNLEEAEARVQDAKQVAEAVCQNKSLLEEFVLDKRAESEKLTMERYIALMDMRELSAQIQQTDDEKRLKSLVSDQLKKAFGIEALQQQLLFLCHHILPALQAKLQEARLALQEKNQLLRDAEAGLQELVNNQVPEIEAAQSAYIYALRACDVAVDRALRYALYMDFTRATTEELENAQSSVASAIERPRILGPALQELDRLNRYLGSLKIAKD